MKNIITKYGLISGVISGILLFITTLLFKYVGFDKIGNYSMLMGYTGMLASLSFIYFGVKAFRDQQSDGSISFLKAFLIGLGIMAISCIIYGLVWLIIYYLFIPTFMDDYASYCIQKTKTEGATAQELQKQIESMNQMKEWYKNPFSIFAITIMEPTPVGFIISLFSAFVLKKKK